MQRSIKPSLLSQSEDRERETMASAEGLVPITREYLSAYYDKYPLDPVVPDVTR